MTDIISDARLAEIRAGLKGCTPGPWMLEIETSEHVDESEDDRQPEVYVCSPDTCCDYTVVATMGRAEAIRHDRKSRDASHIARLDPQTVLSLLSRLDKAEAGWSIEALLSAYEAHTRALPLGAASREKGDSAYNWRMSVIRDLRDLAALPPPPES